MNLHEYQAKKLLAQYGLPIPVGYVCTTPCEAVKIASKIDKAPWIAKCQIHAGGRGKAGGVKLVTNPKDLKKFVEEWLGSRLRTSQTSEYGQPVNQILIEGAIKIYKELYLSVLIDRSISCITVIGSTEGGVNIEKIAQEKPHLLHKIIIDPLIGAQPFQGRSLALKIGLTGDLIVQFVSIFMKLIKLFIECDLLLAEINPLVITTENNLLCLDAKLILDSNSLFRQLELGNQKDLNQEDPIEAYADKWKLNYVALKGNIGCMVNGAGLAMATMDTIKLYGGEAANFLDVGGAVTKERVTEAFKIILSDSKVKAILVNIFGGIVSCNLIAEGIIKAVFEVGIKIPVIVRLEGNQADIGAKKILLSNMSIIVASNLTEAVKLVVSAANANTNNEKNYTNTNIGS
ncbi:MAG: ADP-forming succinate--CoA ligase subunit beta [Candidatus Dasytiphilus stammeri]